MTTSTTNANNLSVDRGAGHYNYRIKSDSDRLLDKVKNNPLLQSYLEFLGKKTTKRGKRAFQTNRQNIDTIKRFLTDNNLNENNISTLVTEELLTEYLQLQKFRGMWLGRIKIFCEFLYKKTDLLDHKKLMDIKLLQLSNISKEKKAFIRPEEIKKWSIPKKRWKEIYGQLDTGPKLFAAFLGTNWGLRAGEIVHFQVSQLQLQFDKIAVFGTDEDEWEPKTLSSNRVLPVTQKQKDYCYRYLEERDRKNLEHDFLIYSVHTKRPIVEDTLRSWFSEVELPFSENGHHYVRTLKPHALRYSFAVEFWKKHGKLLNLSGLLGHKSMSVTEEYLALDREETFKENKKLLTEAGF